MQFVVVTVVDGTCPLQVASRGVDAVGAGFEDPAAIVKALARKKRRS